VPFNKQVLFEPSADVEFEINSLDRITGQTESTILQFAAKRPLGALSKETSSGRLYSITLSPRAGDRAAGARVGRSWNTRQCIALSWTVLLPTEAQH
jgi:hypothetical protein